MSKRSTLGDMTQDELEALVDERIRQALSLTSGDKDETEGLRGRPLEEIIAFIDGHLLTAGPGGPTVAEMIREDRDR